jgi:enterochelin esterase family protein
MMQKTWDIPHESGAIIRHFTLASRILTATSKAGFHSARTHAAFLPAGITDQAQLPVVYLLAPWTSAGRTMFNWEPFREDLPSRLSRLIAQKTIPPCIVICPDLYIDYGGSQYINSEWVGHHADHLIHELIPFVEQNFPVKKGYQHRTALGRSSGGFGALRFALDFDDAFAAVGCHAGDMGFEWTYRRSLIDICSGLYKFQDPVIWMSELKKQKKLSGFDTHVLMMLGMAAFYSPNLSNPAGFDLPITLRNGEIIESVWNRWLSHDPLEIINESRSQERLGKLKTLFIDCGNRDQYFLHYGARQFSAKLQKLGITHSYYEFDDNHSGTAYRFDESLPKLLSAIS